jgi:glycosyltransferase involved in cell wall biosynthesis
MPEVRRPSGREADARAAPRLIYVATADWYFLSHCLPMARAARAAGFEVHVAANVTEDAAKIRGEGFILHAVRFGRRRLSPLQRLRTISTLRDLYRVVDPAIVHHVAIEPALLGIVASFRCEFAAVYALTGLQPTSPTCPPGSAGVSPAFPIAAMPALVARSNAGETGHPKNASVFGDPTPALPGGEGREGAAPAAKRRSLSPRRRLLLRLGLKRRRAVGLVQTPDDREVLTGLGVKPERIALIPGSGIDADRLRPIPEPDGQVTVAFAERMTADNGARTLMEAQGILRASGIQSDLLLASTPDPADLTSIPQIEVAGWGRKSGVTWLGHVTDIAAVWRRAHIAVLPSRGGEGVPKSLLEAAAFGRPLIATDVPGCREIVFHEKTGLLVPVDDPQALAAAILRLVRSPAQRVRFGVAARRLVDERFTADLIGQAAVALYQRLLAE